MAQAAYLEAIAPETSDERREILRRELLEYCAFDTLALVRLTRFLSGAGRRDAYDATVSRPARAAAPRGATARARLAVSPESSSVTCSRPGRARASSSVRRPSRSPSS